MRIEHLNITKNDGYVICEGKRVTYKVTRYDPTDFYYLTNFSNVVNDIDQPAVTRNDYKWNLKGFTTSPVNNLVTITSVDGSLPETFIGKTYRIFKRYGTGAFHFPETGNFSIQFWAKCVVYSGAGGFVGVRFHASENALFQRASTVYSGSRYDLFLKGLNSTMYYNGGGYVRDNDSTNAVVNKATWHFYSMEIDRDNGIAYFFSDGIVREEDKFTEFVNDNSRFSTDAQNYDMQIGIAEFSIVPFLKSTGTGASRTYPIPEGPQV